MAATTRVRRRTRAAPKKKAGGGGSKLSSFLFPWKLPPGLKSSDDMSEEEIVAEAQEARPLLREVGWRDAAVFHPDVMNVRYLRTCHYIGKLPIKPMIVQWGVTIGFSVLLAIMFLFGPTQEAEDLALGKGVYAIFGGVSGLLFGTGMGYSARTLAQFWVAHAPARIAQKKTINGIKQTVAVYELPLLRLAFADRHGEHMFSGVEQQSGFVNGRMNLETDLELSMVTTPDTFYMPGAVRPCVSDFTGVSTHRRHALNDLAKKAGRIDAEKQAIREEGEGVGNWIGEHKGLTFFIVAAIVSIFVLAIGVEIDFSGLSSVGGLF